MSPVRSPRRRAAIAIAVATAAAVGLAGCSSSKKSSSGSSGGKVSIVGYSVPKPAYTALESAFVATSAGKGVKFSESYGPSGSQSKAVAAGQPADYVNFSVGSDMTKLVPSFVASGWDSGATKGIVSDSVVVIVTKKGNPLHITGWDDLIKPGVKIVTPDPASSGSAKWNILAAYEHVISNGGTPAQAAAYLTEFFKHVVAKPSSGSNAMTTFTSGTGDVVISYEAEAIAARQKGQSIDYVIPNESVLIETPAAVTLKASQAAKDFLAFALTTQGQQIFASKGFRPAVTGVTPGTVQGANDPANPYPSVPKLTTISQLGGWSTVNKTFFDPDNGIVTKIEAQTG